MFEELERNGDKKREASLLASLEFYIKCRKTHKSLLHG